MTNTKTIQLNQLKQAETLVNESKYDQALDLLTRGNCGQRAADIFSKSYVSKQELKSYTHVKLSAWPQLGNWSLDNLGTATWFKCGDRDHKTSTVTIANAGGEIIYDVHNCETLLKK